MESFVWFKVFFSVSVKFWRVIIMLKISVGVINILVSACEVHGECQDFGRRATVPEKLLLK